MLQVLSLYCCLPYGQITPSNARVRALAAAIGRTPGAVSYKLGNFVALDPEMIAAGKKGFDNYSRLDAEVWNEFHGRWDALVEAAEPAVLEIANAPAPETRSKRKGGVLRAPPTVTERVVSRKERVGQDWFRAAVLAGYDEKCCITGIAEKRFLRASHIVPWRGKGNEPHRLNPTNGLCLSALHDAAFDGHLMTLDESLRVVLSRQLKEAQPRRVYREMFERFEGQAITMAEKFRPDEEFLRVHREQFAVV